MRYQLLEFLQALIGLIVERHFNNGDQASADLIRCDDSHLAQDHAGVGQTFDATQASRRRSMHLLRQLLISLEASACKAFKMRRLNSSRTIFICNIYIILKYK